MGHKSLRDENSATPSSSHWISRHQSIQIILHICATKGQKAPCNFCKCKKDAERPWKCLVCSQSIHAVDLSGLGAGLFNQEAITILDALDFYCNQVGSYIWWRRDCLLSLTFRTLTQLAAAPALLIISTGNSNKMVCWTKSKCIL